MQLDYSQWPWARSLALTKRDQAVEVEEILFGAVRDYCSYVGIRKGSVVTCRNSDGDAVEVELPGGDTACLSREYAWFVLVHEAK